MAVPHHPRRIATSVEILQFLHFFECIHAGPKAVMRIGKKLARCNQPAKRLFYQFFSLAQTLKDFSPQYEEATVNSRSGFGNMLDAFYSAFLIERYHVKARFRLYTDKTSQFSAFQELFY